MENSILHSSNSRGHANHGWLDSYHTFSFANYYNPQRMNFGVLRVLNDDIIAGGYGFGMHPHDNMEIITIPLEGDLEHQDSMGNVGIIRQGDIQVMSAGTGIQHSEKNKNHDTAVKLLQLWVLPNKRNVAPRYEQQTLHTESLRNNFQQIVSPSSQDTGLWIHQNAWLSLGHFDQNFSIQYTPRSKGNGIYIFVVAGSARVNGQELSLRDGYGIWDIEKITLTALSPNTQLLLMDVPME